MGKSTSVVARAAMNASLNVFKCLNCTFCSVHAVIVRLNELKVTILFREEGFDVFSGLVVHYVQFRCKALLGEFVEMLFVRGKNCFVVKALNRCGKDEVRFVMV